MVDEVVLGKALHELKKLHATHKALNGFCAFPDDVKAQDIIAYHVPAADLFQSEQGLRASDYPELRDVLLDMSPDMIWRETYKDTDIGGDFMDRFGCYEIIGRDAPLASAKMRSFLVYQPPHLHYPWHHHPAEELYVVIAGEAEFHLQGKGAEVLRSGQSSFHPSGVPHALTSHDHPVLAYVVWRDDFDVAPVWTDVE
jgi:mannose-6-phosphate isomerase-like protein (cupin superfamily)